MDYAIALARTGVERAYEARWAFAGTFVLWIPLLLWFLGNRPGFMTFDTFDVWRQVVTHHWEDTHPVSYVIAMKFSQMFVGSLSLLAFAQTIYIAFGLGMLCRALVRAGCHRVATYGVVVIVSWLPQVGGFTITLWKDIPYTAAMLCVTARVIDIFSFRLSRPKAVLPRWLLRSLFVHLLAVVVFRQNGIFFAVFLGAMLLAVKTGRRRGVAVMTTALFVIFLTIKLAVYPAIGVMHTPAENNLAGFVHDIDAALVKNPEIFSQEDLAMLERAMPLTQWRNSYYCYAIINWYLNPSMRLNAFREDSSEYLALWRKVLREAPGTVISNRICVASLAWRVDQKGSGYIYTLTYGVPDNPYGFKTNPVIPRLRPRMLKMLAWTDIPHRLWYTWRAPGWIYLLDLLLIAQAVRFRRWVWLLPGAVPLAQQLNVMVLNPSQDARYMFGAYMIAISTLSVAVLSRRSVRLANAEFDGDDAHELDEDDTYELEEGEDLEPAEGPPDESD